MRKDELLTLKVGDLVVCPEVDENMQEGWNDSMTEMIGMSLKVRLVSKTRGYVILQHPNDGENFQFGYRNIQKVNKKKISFICNGKNYSAFENIDLFFIRSVSLKKDYMLLKEIIKTQKLKLTSNILSKIKSDCPRIIGVLMSNGLLKVDYGN